MNTNDNRRKHNRRKHNRRKHNRKENGKEYRDYIARRKGFKNHKEYLDHLAKEKGFENYLEFINNRIIEKGFKNRSDYYDHLAQRRGFNNFKDEFLHKKGFKTINDYNKYLFKQKNGYDYITTKIRLDNWAKNSGFSDYKEYIDIISIVRGLPNIPNIICDDRSNPLFTGHIAEYGISMVFKNMKSTFFSNRGYDFICDGLKIDVKSSVLHSNNVFRFLIKQNDISDYFMLVGIDNVLDLNPLHFWVIKGTELICGIPLKDKEVLNITNDKNSISDFKKFENINRLEDLKIVFLNYNKDSGVYDNSITKVNILQKLKIPADTKIEEILRIIKAKQKQKRYSHRLTICPKEECSR